MKDWLESFRDRVVVRSQVSKRKLDAARLRRELDHKVLDLGYRLLKMVRDGRLTLPSEAAEVLTEVRELEAKLEAEQAEIAALRSETV